MGTRHPHTVFRLCCPAHSTTTALSNALSPCANVRGNRPTSVSASAILLPSHIQVRHATLIPRPRRPYHFTQLVQLSDGSTYTVRTTSPAPLHRSTTDSRNTALWQPSDASLQNIEVDEAGKLAAFRARFGRGFDVEAPAAPGRGEAAVEEVKKEVEVEGDRKGNVERSKAQATAEETDRTDAAPAKEQLPLEDSLMDLISGYAADAQQAGGGGLTASQEAKQVKEAKAARKKKK